MEILQFTKKAFSILGFNLYRSNPNYSFNRKNLWTIFILFSCVILSVVYFFHVANTFNEYADSSYVVIGASNTLINVFVFIWKMEPTSKYIDSIQEIINNS